MTSYDDLADILDDDDLFGELEEEGLFNTQRYQRTVMAKSTASSRKRVGRDFNSYQVLFEAVRADLATGQRQIRAIASIEDQQRITKDNPLKQGNFYVDNGIMLYLAKIYDPETGEEFSQSTNRKHKVHTVYENGTENHIWLLSLVSSLYDKKRHGRLVTEREDQIDLMGQGLTTGYIYVVSYAGTDQRFLNLANLYKIGFATDIQQRLRGTENQATYLYAPVQLVASYEVKNVDARKVETYLHHVFAEQRIHLSITGNNGREVTVNEWFLVDLEEIEQAIHQLIVELVMD